MTNDDYRRAEFRREEQLRDFDRQQAHRRDEEWDQTLRSDREDERRHAESAREQAWKEAIGGNFRYALHLLGLDPPEDRLELRRDESSSSSFFPPGYDAELLKYMRRIKEALLQDLPPHLQNRLVELTLTAPTAEALLVELVGLIEAEKSPLLGKSIRPSLRKEHINLIQLTIDREREAVNRKFDLMVSSLQQLISARRLYDQVVRFQRKGI